MAVLTVIAGALAGRSLAAILRVLPVRSIAGYCWSGVICGASHHIAGLGRAKPRDHRCFAFPGAHELF